MRKVSVGVVGVGAFGTRHAHAFAASPWGRLVAVVDVDEGRAREVAERFRARWYVDLDEMLSKEEVEAISIATPTPLHALSAIRCARAGKHIFLEKPMASSVEEADAILDAVRSANVRLMVNLIVRFDPRYAAAAEVIHRGEIGNVVTLSARRVGLYERGRASAQWNDLLLGTAIHDIDLMHWYSQSRVTHVYGEAITALFKDFGVEDAIMCVLRFGSGAIGSIETSWLLPSNSPRWLESRMDVVGTDGRIRITDDQGLAVLTPGGETAPDILNWPVLEGRIRGNLVEVVNTFLRCIMEGTEPVPGGLEGREALAVAAAIKRSCSTGRQVALTEL